LKSGRGIGNVVFSCGDTSRGLERERESREMAHSSAHDTGGRGSVNSSSAVSHTVSTGQAEGSLESQIWEPTETARGE